jgi:hypothetical protein
MKSNKEKNRVKTDLIKTGYGNVNCKLIDVEPTRFITVLTLMSSRMNALYGRHAEVFMTRIRNRFS